MKQDCISVEGLVVQELGNSMFKVELDVGEQEIICTISGKIRKNYIRIMSGDRVKVEMSPYDLTKGRIVTRLKTVSNNKPNNNNTDEKNK